MLKPEHQISVAEISCSDCGRCCVKTIPYLDVELTSNDILRIPDNLYAIRKGGEGSSISFWMRRHRNGECICFNSETKQCNIYDRRPAECRDFAVGNELCLKLVGAGNESK